MFSGTVHHRSLLLPATRSLFPFTGSADVLKFISGAVRVTRYWICWGRGHMSQVFTYNERVGGSGNVEGDLVFT